MNFPSYRRHSVSITKHAGSVLCKELIAAYSGNETKHVGLLAGLWEKYSNFNRNVRGVHRCALHVLKDFRDARVQLEKILQQL